MDFIFQGFDSALPVWLYLLIFAGTTFLAWWSYSSITGIRKLYRYVLITLRSIVFFILLLLLLNPFLKAENPYFEKSKILVMLDNSASTAIKKNVYKGTDSYKKVLRDLNFADSSEVNFDFFSIGNTTQPSAESDLTFDADQTNLAQALNLIRENQSETKAAVLISDGVYTKGENPIFDSGNLEIPIFTVGLGDTTFQKDLLVSSVTTNSTGYLNSQHPVTVAVATTGFKGQSFQIQLQKDNQIIATKTVTPELSSSTQDVSFELPLEKEGLQQYKVIIPKLADEWTDANNSQLFSVDVKDARQQILSLAFEVHPDVKFIRSLLLSDKNTNLISRTWLRGNRFVEGPFALDPDTIDLAIIHGYPKSGLSDELKQSVAELAEKVPLIIESTPLFSPQRFEEDVASLPVTVVGPWDFTSVSIHPEVESNAHPIMELPVVSYNRLPMIEAPVNNLDNAPGPKKLFSSNFRGNDTQKPILVVHDLGNKRMALFTGFGWFRLDQSSNSQIRDFVEQLWLNTVSWTATDPQNQLLEVQPAQRSFTGSEPVVINAYLNNGRGEVESEATIDASVSSDSMDARFYSMENKGGGQYQLDLGTMPEGIYSFEATAKKGSRKIESRNGEFAVARSNAEYLSTNRNSQLLQQISKRSGGDYVPFDSLSGFWDKLEQRGLLKENRQVETTFFYPHQHFLWFIIVLVLLGAEWIFRKYLSLP